MDPDGTPSPFLLSSETFENGIGQDPIVAGDVSEDDETPTTSPGNDLPAEKGCHVFPPVYSVPTIRRGDVPPHR